MPFSFLGRRFAPLALLGPLVLLSACKDEPEKPPASNTCFQTLVLNEDISLCEALPSDYQPRSNLASWGTYACTVNENPNQYQAINETDISTITRVAAFDKMAALLWKNPQPPSSEDFTQAREMYSTDEGLDSRVQRREDVHFPVLPDCKRCNQVDNTVQQQHADRCAGPMKIAPIINAAFREGMAGNSPLAQARKIEAALLWFHHLSALSEVQTCANEPKNCDSAWSYYTGGTSRDTLKGLAAYVHAASPETHHLAYDAALAVRCWRDVDKATPAANTDLQYRALKQYDKALSRGMALILREKVVEWEGAHEAEKFAEMQAFVQTLFGLMENSLMRFAKTGALPHKEGLVHELKALIESASPNSTSIGKMNELLDSLFPCS